MNKLNHFEQLNVQCIRLNTSLGTGELGCTKNVPNGKVLKKLLQVLVCYLKVLQKLLQFWYVILVF